MGTFTERGSHAFEVCRRESIEGHLCSDVQLGFPGSRSRTCVNGGE